jgi:hypothetical protein
MDNMLNMWCMRHFVELSDLINEINVIKIDHLNMTNYDYNVTFDFVCVCVCVCIYGLSYQKKLK